MTHSHEPIRRFDCVPSTDGCDNTFDIVSRTTGRRIGWAPYWEQRTAAKRSALKLMSVLEALVDGNLRLDMAALLEEQRQVAVVWSVEDVQEVRPDLTDGQAWIVLQHCDRRHDCNDGFTLPLIESAAEKLFPEQRDNHTQSKED